MHVALQALGHRLDALFKEGAEDVKTYTIDFHNPSGSDQTLHWEIHPCGIPGEPDCRIVWRPDVRRRRTFVLSTKRQRAIFDILYAFVSSESDKVEFTRKELYFAGTTDETTEPQELRAIWINGQCHALEGVPLNEWRHWTQNLQLMIAKRTHPIHVSYDDSECIVRGTGGAEVCRTRYSDGKMFITYNGWGGNQTFPIFDVYQLAERSRDRTVQTRNLNDTHDTPDMINLINEFLLTDPAPYTINFCDCPGDWQIYPRGGVADCRIKWSRTTSSRYTAETFILSTEAQLFDKLFEYVSSSSFFVFKTTELCFQGTMDTDGRPTELSGIRIDGTDHAIKGIKPTGS